MNILSPLRDNKHLSWWDEWLIWIDYMWDGSGITLSYHPHLLDRPPVHPVTFGSDKKDRLRKCLFVRASWTIFPLLRPLLLQPLSPALSSFVSIVRDSLSHVELCNIVTLHKRCQVLDTYWRRCLKSTPASRSLMLALFGASLVFINAWATIYLQEKY